MEELAFVAISDDLMPSDSSKLKSLLLKFGLNGTYSEEEGILFLENESGIFEFVLSDKSFFEDLNLEDFPEISSGIEIIGDFNDPAEVLLTLESIFKKAFPDSDFSTAFDD